MPIEMQSSHFMVGTDLNTTQYMKKKVMGNMFGFLANAGFKVSVKKQTNDR